MWRHPILQGILGIYVAWGAWHWYANRPVQHPDGVTAAADPQQTNFKSEADTPAFDDPAPVPVPLQLGRWTLMPRAHYVITARVLSREDYRFDPLADLIPEDLALGWGPMSDSRNLRDIKISQGNRFYYWHYDTVPPIPPQSIIEHSANTHVIPRDRAVGILLSRIRPGQIVTLTGELVDGKRADGGSIRTSMVRTDSGAGACEVMLVSDVSIDR